MIEMRLMSGIGHSFGRGTAEKGRPVGVRSSAGCPDDRVIFGRDDREVRVWSAGEASGGCRVPAAVACILPARQTEVECSTERLGQAARVLAAVFLARQREGIADRLGVGEKEVLQAPRQDARALERRALGRAGSEVVAGATPLAERVGHFGHCRSVVLHARLERCWHSVYIGGYAAISHTALGLLVLVDEADGPVECKVSCKETQLGPGI